MASFQKRVYRSRKVEFPNRRRLTLVDGEDDVYTVSREGVEGIIQQEGDQWAPPVMEDLEDRVAAAFDEKSNIKSPAFEGIPTVPTALLGTNTNQVASTRFTQQEITNAKAKKTTVTVTNSGWAAVADNGQTVYRKSTGVIGAANQLPVPGLPPGQIKQITATILLVNDNGTVFVYSAQVPNISLTLTVTMIETR